MDKTGTLDTPSHQDRQLLGLSSCFFFVWDSHLSAGRRASWQFEAGVCEQQLCRWICHRLTGSIGILRLIANICFDALQY
jgi:hypothetical protein